MLASDAVAARMRKEVSLEDLEDRDCRAVAGGVFALLDSGVTEGISSRLHFEEGRLNGLAASWMVDGEFGRDEEAALQEAQDCLDRIRRRRIDRESRLLQEKIADAEKAGNKDMLYKLLRIKQELRLQAD